MPFSQTIGSRRQVWNGTAEKTSGGLKKSDLIMSHGRIVSKSKHFSAKKEMRLLKYGYGTQKGKFGYVKVGKKTRSHKGGSGNGPLNPANVDADYMMKGVVSQHFGPLQRALVGGRHRSRSMRGGMSSLAPADVNANAIGGLMSDGPIISSTPYRSPDESIDVQMEAGQAGGRSRSRGRSRGRSRMMRGGTSDRHHLMPSLVQQRALMA